MAEDRDVLEADDAGEERDWPEPPRLEEDEYLIPLRDQRVFGAGLKRKRVLFVPGSEVSSTVQSTQLASASAIAPTIGRNYLDLVLPKKSSSEPPASEVPEDQKAVANCPDCNQPVGPDHGSSLAHLLSLPETQPSSHLPRNTLGMRYLTANGWNPDARQGLGSNGDGIRHPIKITEKHNRLGIGVEVPVEVLEGKVPKNKKSAVDRSKSLTAKDIRQQEKRSKATAARLHQEFYGNEELQKHLGM